MGLAAESVLLSATHTHAGPSVGTWAWAAHLPPLEAYVDRLERALLRAAGSAREAATDVSLRAGCGRSQVPMNRRRLRDDGSAVFAPNPEGTVCDRLPVVVLETAAGHPVAWLFSVSCHPSMAAGREFSADFPGAACAALDTAAGAPVAMFLQGAGGDAKPALCAAPDGSRWQSADWQAIETTGRTVAGEVMAVVESDLESATPRLRSALVEVPLGLAAPRPRRELARLAATIDRAGPIEDQDLQALWAARELERIDRDEPAADSVTVRVQGIQLAGAVRLVALEGEAVAELGLHIERQFAPGVTFPLGYANGQGLYLPVERMLAEGGYEVQSYWEYGLPAPLAEGAERVVDRALPLLRERAIA
jgi:hypothetical protein